MSEIESSGKDVDNVLTALEATGGRRLGVLACCGGAMRTNQRVFMCSRSDGQHTARTRSRASLQADVFLCWVGLESHGHGIMRCCVDRHSPLDR